MALGTGLFDRFFGASLSSIKRYTSMVDERKPLDPKEAPSKRLKIDGRAERLLEADLEWRPAMTLAHRRKFLNSLAVT